MGRRQWVTQARVLAGIAHGSRAFGPPYQACLSLTDRCNVRCIHCFRYSPLFEAPGPAGPKERRRAEADPERTRALIDELVRMGVQRFQLSGNGEAFLHGDLLDFIGRLSQAGCDWVVNTNGTMLDRAKIDELVRIGTGELRVTTMAHCEEVYALTHPGSPPGTFSAIKDSLLALAAAKRAAGASGPVVYAVSVAVRQNYDRLMEFARFAHEVGADGLILHPVDDQKDPRMAPLVPTEAEAAVVRAQVREMARFAERHGMRHNLNEFLMVFNRELNTRAIYRVVPCVMGWALVMVDSEGLVRPCCRHPEPLGNAYETPIQEIWQSAAYREFRRAAAQINRRGTPVDGAACYSCPNTGANLRVFRRLHPLSLRLRALERASEAAEVGGEE